jgi:hypothetical protein
MIYKVVLQRLAVIDLQGYFEFAARHSLPDAQRWLDRFHAALQTLEERPERCSLAWEDDKVDVGLREFLFGKRPYVFRVIFTIDGDTVRILRIRRSQRRTLSAKEIREALSQDE